MVFPSLRRIRSPPSWNTKTRLNPLKSRRSRGIRKPFSTSLCRLPQGHNPTGLMHLSHPIPPNLYPLRHRSPPAPRAHRCFEPGPKLLRLLPRQNMAHRPTLLPGNFSFHEIHLSTDSPSRPIFTKMQRNAPSASCTIPRISIVPGAVTSLFAPNVSFR